MKKKTFVTLFPLTENIHLVKDVGMIPFMLQKEHDFQAYVASYCIGTYPYLEKEVKGLKHIIIKRYTGNQYIDSCLFIFFNFWKIDVLQVYHLGIWNLLILYLFKCLNFYKKTKSYLKLDANDKILNFKLQGVKGIIYKYFILDVNVISIETKILYNELIKIQYFKNLIYLPNGFYGKKNVLLSKQPFFLTVGRIGTHPKNTELLLEAYKRKQKNLNGWKLVIVGPIEEKENDFKDYIQKFFIENPHLRSEIEFVGAIFDRELLYSYYDKANVFVLTSLNEGFALVYLEAIQAGCRIVSSDITPAFDIILNDRIGYLFTNNDVEDLGLKLIKISSEGINVKDNLYIQDFAYENFDWSKIVNGLNARLIQGF